MIEEEYLLSEGDVRPGLVRAALAGLGDPAAAFPHADLDRVRRELRGRT